MNLLELELLTKDVKSIVLSVGDYIREQASVFDNNKIVYKAENDLVSYVDKNAEKLLVKGLGQLFPEADFITEEGSAGRDNKAYTWVIDPLDGTTNFTHGLPVYSISVALYENEYPILGVVLEVNRKELFWAFKDGGAFLNDLSIKCSATAELKKSLIATGFPYSMLGKEDDYFLLLKNLQLQSQGIRRLGSAAVDLCYVACGRFEAYFEYNLNAYDVGAGALIVQEAGGTVSNFTGLNKDWNSGKEIVASGAIHSTLINFIKKYWKSSL
jgi:myo-inositol-1(or 4)-monophosphatase